MRLLLAGFLGLVVSVFGLGLGLVWLLMVLGLSMRMLRRNLPVLILHHFEILVALFSLTLGLSNFITTLLDFLLGGIVFLATEELEILRLGFLSSCSVWLLIVLFESALVKLTSLAKLILLRVEVGVLLTVDWLVVVV